MKRSKLVRASFPCSRRVRSMDLMISSIGSSPVPRATGFLTRFVLPSGSNDAAFTGAGGRFFPKGPRLPNIGSLVIHDGGNSRRFDALPEKCRVFVLGTRLGYAG